MISTDISISDKVEEGADFDVVLFDRMLVHQDDWGRMIGEPPKVKARLRPLARQGPARFERAIRLYAQLGLICWYEVNDHKYIALKPESCEEYQTGIHAKAVDRGRKSQYPPPPAPDFRWPEDGPAPPNPELSGAVLDGPAEHNTTQPNLTQHKNDIGASGKPSRPRSKPRKLTDEQNDVKQRLIKHYQECMVAFCEDETPEFNGGHAAGFFTQQILKGRAEEKLTATIDAFFDAQDGLRRVRRERAAMGVYKPRPVDVTFDVFKSKFQGYWSEVGT